MKDTNEHNKYLLVSTGSGISPMVALYQHLRKDTNNVIVNIFGERYHRHMLPSVEQLFSESTSNVKNMLFLSQETEDLAALPAAYRPGHVQLALDEALEHLGTKDITVFLCGSPVMVDDVKQMLTER